jgi:HK97 family phage major capsid protein
MSATERDEILAAVRGELGKHGEQIAERMKADADKIAALEAAIKALTGEAGERFKGRYFGAIADGKPMTMNFGEGVDSFLERGQERAGEVVSYARLDDGAVLPVLRQASRSTPRRQKLMGARMIRAMAAAVATGERGDHESALRIAKSWEDKALQGALEETRDLVRDLHGTDRVAAQRAQRALGTVSLGSGASLVAPQYAAQIIDYLHPIAVVRSLGAQVLPLSAGTLSMPFFSSAVTASYQAEHSGPNEGSPADGRLNFARKILTAIVALSKELLRESSYSVDEFLMRHIAQAMAAREDLAFIRGDGTQNTPLGLAYFAGLSSGGGDAHAFNRTLDTGAVTVQTITTDSVKAMRVVEESKVPMARCGWIFSTRDAYGLMAKRNATTSVEVWPELKAGNFYGHPFRKTPQIPKTLAGDGAGTGTNNKSEVYFADFGCVAIAEQESIEINAYDGGAYKDSSGNVVSGITNREVVIAAAAAHDFGCLYRGDEVAKIGSVDWGA